MFRTYTKLDKSLIINTLNVRSMFKLVNQPAVNMRIIRPVLYNQVQLREMACFHGSKFRNGAKKPIVQSTDLSGNHKIIVKTTCPAKECETINCADGNNPNQINPCGRSVAQNQISPGNTRDGFVTEIVGNTTKAIPAGLPGKKIDTSITYGWLTNFSKDGRGISSCQSE